MPPNPLSAFFFKCERCRTPFGIWRGRSCPFCGGLASGFAAVIPAPGPQPLTSFGSLAHA